MSKIICDVCGTSYPESATQCPICGCVRSVDARVVAGSTNDVEAQSSGTYTYVKGGRFSKANVKKRNKGMAVTPVETTRQDMPDARENGKKDVGIVITTVFLLLAIVAVVIYIAVRFFGPVLFGDDKDIVKPPVNNAQLWKPRRKPLPQFPVKRLFCLRQKSLLKQRAQHCF